MQLCSADLSSSDDAALLRYIGSRSEEALEELIKRHRHRLLRVAHRCLGSYCDAEEAVQDSFVAVWNTASSFRGESSVVYWLSVLCRNIAVSRLRRRQKLTTEDLANAIAAPACEADPACQAWKSYRRQIVVQCVLRLPRAAQQALIMHVYQGLTYCDIGRRCHCPPGTVRSRIYYAKVRLRQLITQYDIDNCLRGDDP
jgi:RNA polymerase sigma-70 factor (ECF subfamily)